MVQTKTQPKTKFDLGGFFFVHQKCFETVAALHKFKFFICFFFAFHTTTIILFSWLDSTDFLFGKFGVSGGDYDLQLLNFGLRSIFMMDLSVFILESVLWEGLLLFSQIP